MGEIGSRILELASVDSTNAEAARGLAKGDLRHGDVVTALEQTAGRGRRGSRWETGPGLDLACSVVLQPDRLAATEQFLLAKAVALAVHAVVRGTLVEAGRDEHEVRIKWPNDVLVGRGKLSGILVENELRGPLVATSIVGIGLNVNSSAFDDAFQATSLRMETGVEHRVAEVLTHVCAALEHEWRRMSADPEAVGKDYADLLWAKGRFTDFLLDGLPWRGRALDVDEQGRLVAEGPEGEVAAFGMERLRYGARN